VSRLPEPVGRLCVVPDTQERMIAAVDCTIIRFNIGRILPKFFICYSLFTEYAAQVDKLTTGTTRQRISRSNLGSVSVPVPPLAEQQRIVAILDQAFEGTATATANAEKNVANARELFDRYLFAVLVSLGDRGFSVPLEQACERVTVGHVGPMADAYKESGTPFLRSQNVRPFAIDLDEVKYIDDDFDLQLRKSQLRPGDVVIVRTGYPGTAAVIPDTLPAANCADLVIVRPRARLNPEYLAVFLNSPLGRTLVSGNLNGAAQKHFNVTAAKQALVPLQDVAEQARIVNQAREARKEVEALRKLYTRKLAALAELKQSLLARAFSGELTASDALAA
jgi:type I restriction enzyme, S subunit